MSGGQIAALVFAVILLIPGGCFTVFGIGMLGDPGSYGLGPPFLIIGLVILAFVAFLGWVAFHKRNPPGSPDQPKV
jgi:membrane protein implicated in regulation of membrane protease activity